MNLVNSNRKLVLFKLLALLAVCVSATVAYATPYATCLTNNSGVVSFRINESGATVKVVGNQFTLTNILGVLPVGLTVTNLSSAGGSSIMTGGVFQVVVDKTGTGSPFQVLPTLATTNFQMFESPRGVGVNVRPASPYFGRVYVGNTRTNSTASGRTMGDGIYVLNADSTDALGQGNTALTGGLDMVINPAVSIYSFMPWRIRVGANNDMLYLCNWTDTNRPNLYQVDPNVSASSGVAVFQDFTPVEDPLVPALPPVGAANNHGSVAEVIVTGSQAGGDLKVYSVDEDYQTDPTAGAPFTERNSLWRYDIGSGSFPWTTAPNQKLATPSVGSVSQTMGLDRASNGYFYHLVSRSAGSENCLTVIDPAGPTVLYQSRPDSLALGLGRDWFSNCCSVAVSPDMKYIAAQRNAGQVLVVPLTNGIPNLPARIEFLGIGTARQIIFDAANNLYLVSNATERMRIWSLGITATAITTSNPGGNGGEGGSFNLIPAPLLNIAATANQASETGPVAAEFTINRSLNTVSDIIVSYTLTGTAVSNVDYTVSPTSPFVFQAGQTSTNITITPIDDSIREATETVTMTVSTAQAYTISGGASVAATITDNDAVLLHWDADGATAGAGGLTPTGTWGTDNFWSTSALGDAATAAWVNWQTAVFSAGADAGGAFTVTLSSPQLVDHLEVEEGDVTVTGSSLTLTNFDAIKLGLGLTATIDSVLNGAGLWLNGPGTLVLGANNTYSGSTLIETGTVRIAASDRIPDSSALTIGAGGALDLNSFNEMVGSLAGVAGAVVTVPFSSTLTFGGNNSSTTWSGSANGGSGGSLVKVGTGTNTITAPGVVGDALAISNGMVTFDAAARLGTQNGITIANNAILQGTSPTVGADFIGPNKTIAIDATGGTLRVNEAAAILFVRDFSVISGPGTLTKDGPGELRTYTVDHSYGKLNVKQGLFTAGHSTFLPYNSSFGAVPVATTADAITIQAGASIRKAGGQNVALDPKQGITLTGAGTKTIRSYAGFGPLQGSTAENFTGTFEIASVITGTGPLRLNAVNDDAPTIVLSGSNTYSGNTEIVAGHVFARNTSGSSTGSGGVNVTNALLGGDGIIGGPVVMSGGRLSPGYNYNTGPTPVVPVTQEVGKLTLTNGLSMNLGATNVWHLGEFSTSNPGTDFDQVELTAGNLVLGGSSVLSLNFTNNAAAPSPDNTMWFQNREWTIVKLSGTAANPGSTKYTTIINGNYPGVGSFTNYVGPGGSIVLKFVSLLTPVISSSVTGATTGNPVITWSSYPNASYTVEYATNLNTPITWHVLTNILGDPGATTAIQDASGFQTQRYYRVVMP